jgi:hypothetical protein
MNPISSIFGFRDAGEDAHVALEAVLERLSVPYDDESSLLDKIERLSHAAIVLYRTCDKLKSRNASLLSVRDSLTELNSRLALRLSEKEELVQFYKTNTDFDEAIEEDEEDRTRFEILRNLSLSSMLELHGHRMKVKEDPHGPDDIVSSLETTRDLKANEEENLLEQIAGLSASHDQMNQHRALALHEKEDIHRESQVLNDKLIQEKERLARQLDDVLRELEVLTARHEKVCRERDSRRMIDEKLNGRLAEVLGCEDRGEAVDFMMEMIVQTISEVRKDYEDGLRDERARSRKYRSLYGYERRYRQYG